MNPETQKISFKELIEDLKNPLWHRRNEAADALVAKGNLAVPHLTEALQEEHEDLRYWATIVMGRIGNEAVIPLIEVLENDSKELKIFACRALAETKDIRAIKPLIKALANEHWSVRKNAADSLKAYGGTVIPHLRDAINGNDEDIIYWSTKTLGDIGEPAIESLLTILKSDSKDKRFFAAMALANTRTPKAIDALIECFSDESWTIRKNAAEALENIGELAIPSLTQALTSKNPDVRHWTTRVLGKIGSKSIQPVLNLLKDKDSEVRKLSRKIMAEIGQSAINPLIEILVSSEDKDMRKNAAESLGEIKSLTSLDALISTLGDSSWFVRKTAADAIISIGREVIPTLTEALSIENEDILYWITVILGSIGKEAVYPLCDILKMGEKEMRYFAAEALGKIADPASIPGLLDALKDPSWPVRKSAAEALEKMGENAIGPLIRSLKNENNDVRFWTKKVLRNFGTEVIPPLSRYLKDGDDDLRIYAAYALGEIKNTKAVPILLKALEDKNEWVRRYVATALGEIGNPSAVGPIIDSMLNETDEMKLLNSRILYKFGLASVPEIIIRLDQKYIPIIPYTAGILKSLGKPGIETAIKVMDYSEDSYGYKVFIDILKAVKKDALEVLQTLSSTENSAEKEKAEKLLKKLQ